MKTALKTTFAAAALGSALTAAPFAATAEHCRSGMGYGMPGYHSGMAHGAYQHSPRMSYGHAGYRQGMGYGAYPGYGSTSGYGSPIPPARGYGMPGRPMMPPGYGQQNQSRPQSPGPSAKASGAETGANDVAISGMRFQSEAIRVKAGETVTWENRDAMPHTVTSRSNGELASDRLGRGSTFKHTFDKPGTYEYFCKVHPSMTGKVIVE